MTDNNLFAVASGVIAPILIVLGRILAKYVPLWIERALGAPPTPAAALAAPAPVGNGYVRATIESVSVASFLTIDLQRVRDEFAKYRQQTDSDLSFFRTENGAVKMQNNQFRVQIAEQQGKITHLEKENVAHETRIVELEKALVNRDDTIARLTARIAALENNGNGHPPTPPAPKPPLAIVDAPQKREDDEDDSADDAQELKKAS